MTERPEKDSNPRSWVVRGLVLVEDFVYIGLGLLLSVSAVALLASGFRSFIVAIAHHALGGEFIGLLDQILLVLLVIELLYTVQVSFREHGLVAEPFFVVALIAVIRRILILAAQLPELPQASEAVFRRAIMELALLGLLIIVLVGSLIQLQKHKPEPE